MGDHALNDDGASTDNIMQIQEDQVLAKRSEIPEIHSVLDCQ